MLLYELLTGRTPFDPEELMRQGLDEMRRTIREQEPQTPSTFVHTMSADLRTSVAQHRQSDPAKFTNLLRGDLDWIVMKALEKDRTRRYETANGLAKDIERHLADEPVLARPASQLYRFQRLVRRNKLTFAAAGVVAIALLLALLILAVSTIRIIKEKDQKDLALGEKGVALQEKGVALEDAKVQLFSSLLNQARAARLSGRMGQRFDSLQALTEAARIRFDERLRDEATAALALPDVRPKPDWIMDGYDCVDASYRLSAKADEQGTITVRSVPDGREIRRIETGNRGYRLSFSSDGRFLAQYAYARTLRVWRVADGFSVLGREPVEYHAGLDISPDSRRLVIGQSGQKNWIVCFDLATGQEIKRWQLPTHAMSLSFHPDNRQLAVGYISGDIASVYDAVEGKNLADLPVGSLGTTVVAWHPDGIRLAVAETAIQMWDVPAKRQLATMEGHATGVSALSFHPDGEILASRGDEAVCRLWQPSSGRQLLQFPGINEPFSFSADGRWLGASLQDKGRRLLEVQPGREYRTIISSLGPGKNVYFDGDLSADGRLLAMGTDDGVRLWDIASGKELAFLPIGRTYSVFFLPGSGGLLTCSEGGLRHWPIQNVKNTEDDLRLGPPRKIWLPFPPMLATRSHDGHTLAVGGEQGEKSALIVDVASESIKGCVLSPLPCEVVGLSPDGLWLATTSIGGSGVQLWEVQTGMLRKHWEESVSTRFWFTPDSRTLIRSRPEEFSLWDVQSLQLIRSQRRAGVFLPGKVAFTTDGKLMAMELLRGVISLNEVATGRTVARLEDPYGGSEGTNWMSFNPAGTQLVTTSGSARAIHVWDLRAIRIQLKQMRLDWDWPEFSKDEIPPASKPSLSRIPRQIEVSAALPVEAGATPETTRFFLQRVKDERARADADRSALLAALAHLAACYASEGRHAEAVPLLAESSVLSPADTMLAEKVAALQAWFGDETGHAATCRRVLGLAMETKDPSVADRAAKAYCLRPSSDPQLLQAALTLARRAVELGKDHAYLPYYQLALGMAEFRRGIYPAADLALSAAENSAKDASEVSRAARFFRAMSLFRQGKKLEARKLFAEAEDGMKPVPAGPFANGFGTEDIIIWLAYKEAKAML